jgi:hypothetical protein
MANVTIGKLDKDGAADIQVDGVTVGWVESVKGERFASASSRARVSYVSHYEIVMTDDRYDAALTEHMRSDVHHADSKADALRIVREVVAKLGGAS